jgi:hypothetical protein
MSNNTILVQDICQRAKDTTKERGHSFSNVVFLFPLAPYFIGFLSYLFPSLILSRVFQRGGQQTDCLEKWLCTDGKTVIIGLADKIEADAKNRNDIVANRYF